ncbi:MAG: hypothetical protein ABJA67_10545 [Chthonomonadales bacterium]
MKYLNIFLLAMLMVDLACIGLTANALDADTHHYLYVAEPGIRNYEQWGGVGIIVFDIDHGHKFVRRIKTLQTVPGVEAENVKGICASAKTGMVYVSTTQRLMRLDLTTDAILWNRTYEGGCDRMAISPDGKFIYLPSLEGPFWRVVSGDTGEVIAEVRPNSGAHNTAIGLDGKFAYLAGLKSPLLRVSDTKTHKVVKEIGPFSNVIRPFTINGKQTLCYVNVNDRLGFEIGDLKTGKVLCKVDVPGVAMGPVLRHGCPSHGVGLTPDEKQVWVCDGHNSKIHIFDNTKMPPVYVASIPVRDQPGWVTFSLDGKFAYPSTGEVVDVKTRKTVTMLTDEQNRPVQSEKMMEIDFIGNRPMRTGDQFGLGRK